MKWRLVHSHVSANTESVVISKSHIVLEADGVKLELAKIDALEEHTLGAKRALVDTANLLRRLAHEMENKADKVK